MIAIADYAQRKSTKKKKIQYRTPIGHISNRNSSIVTVIIPTYSKLFTYIGCF